MAEAHSKSYRVTKQLLKNKSGEFDLESVHSLVLRGLDLSDLGCIGECAGLERLDLSKNDLTKLYALAGLTNLVYLNLSANRISSLEGLQSLDNLKTLNLSGNLIGSVDTLRTLSCLELLTSLRLKDNIHQLSNPICMKVTYKEEVTAMLPILIELDGERLKGKGSELYKFCAELDNHINNTSGETPRDIPIKPEPWLPADFWEKKNMSFENSPLCDAEQQLRELLNNCKKVKEEGSEKIDRFEAQLPSR